MYMCVLKCLTCYLIIFLLSDTSPVKRMYFCVCLCLTSALTCFFSFHSCLTTAHQGQAESQDGGCVVGVTQQTLSK